MNCRGDNCSLRDTCKRYTHQIKGEPFYALSPVWGNPQECAFLLKDETVEERLDADNEARRERFREQTGM